MSRTRLPWLALVVALNFLGLAEQAEAANHYVRPAGATYGTGSGNDWQNACTDFTGSCAVGSLVRGDTYYIAGSSGGGNGTYAGRNFNRATNGSLVITIKKATVADHGGNETGWSNAFGTSQAVFATGIEFGTSFWVFDGVTGGGPGTPGSPQWTIGHGIKIDVSSIGNCSGGIDIQDPFTDIAIRHVEIHGHGPDGSQLCTQDGLNVGSDFTTGVSVGPATTNLIFSHLWVHDIGRVPFFLRAHGVLIEYSRFGKFESCNNGTSSGFACPAPGQHAELMSVWRCATAACPPGATLVQNLTFRYNFVTDGGTPDSTGGIICSCTGLRVYGNIWAGRDGGTFSGVTNGLIGTWSNDSLQNAEVYNNTFIGTNADSGRVFGLFDLPNFNDTLTIRNNLFYQAKVGNDSGGYTACCANITRTHNYYISLVDGPIGSEVTQQTGSSNPFQGFSSEDYRLVTNSTAGFDTGAGPLVAGVQHTFNVDMYGNPRTTWTRGAIEFAAAGPPTPALPFRGGTRRPWRR